MREVYQHDTRLRDIYVLWICLAGECEYTMLHKVTYVMVQSATFLDC